MATRKTKGNRRAETRSGKKKAKPKPKREKTRAKGKRARAPAKPKRVQTRAVPKRMALTAKPPETATVAIKNVPAADMDVVIAEEQASDSFVSATSQREPNGQYTIIVVHRQN